MRKVTDNVLVILIEVHLSLLTVGLVIVKNCQFVNLLIEVHHLPNNTVAVIEN